jgi:type IV pilus assembly protein PilW
MDLAQGGLTLVELMISLVLGMLIVAAAIMLMLSSKSSYVVEDDSARLLDSGRYAIESMSRALRQVGFEDIATNGVPIVALPTSTPNITGLDASTYGDAAAGGLPAPSAVTVSPSDILQVRFFGAGDGTILDCTGAAVSAATTSSAIDTERGWSVFFVKPGADGDAELHCGHLNAAGVFESLPIAGGVESFQVLYGVDAGGDATPDRFYTADEISALDAAAGALPTSAGSSWKNVATVKISLLLKGQAHTEFEDQTIPLFGSDYANAGDQGSVVNVQRLPPDQQRRIRKLFTTVIQLRNSARGGSVGPIL